MPSASTYGSIGDPAPSWIHDPPRSTAAPPTSTVWVRPPIRSRPSMTTTSTPLSCSARAAVSPEMPAPTTTTRPTGPSTGSGTEPVRSSACTSGVEARLAIVRRVDAHPAPRRAPANAAVTVAVERPGELGFACVLALTTTGSVDRSAIFRAWGAVRHLPCRTRRTGARCRPRSPRTSGPTASRSSSTATVSVSWSTATTARGDRPVRSFNHTEIEDGHEGQGLAGRLVSAALDATRNDGFDVLPFCPYRPPVHRRSPRVPRPRSGGAT